MSKGDVTWVQGIKRCYHQVLSCMYKGHIGDRWERLEGVCQFLLGAGGYSTPRLECHFGMSVWPERLEMGLTEWTTPNLGS